MTIFDLVLLFSVFVVLLGLAGILLAVVTRRWGMLRRFSWGLIIYLGVYALVLAGVSLLSPQRVLAMHEVRCFDDWCLSVEGVEKQAVIGAAQAQGDFYLVTLQVSNRARGIRQRANEVSVYLIDEQGVRYDPSPEGEQALAEAGLAGRPLTTMMDVGGGFEHTAVFDIPRDVTQLDLLTDHGAFPGLIIIGSDQSWLHKPTIVHLPMP